jgi:hypothetical protein
MNFNYYREFNPKLKNMNNNELINYFYYNSKKQIKIFNEETFYYLYPDFDYLLYASMNKDLIGYSKFKMQQHYHLYGKNEKRIYSKKKFYECYPNFVVENNNLNNSIQEYEILSNYHNNNIKKEKKNNNNNYMDINYYREFNKDLKGYREDYLNKYFFRYGEREKRIYNEETFYQFYPDFDYDFYIRINIDLNILLKFDAQVHYHSNGYYEKRIYSQKSFYEKYSSFNLEEYKKYNKEIIFTDDFHYLIKFHNESIVKENIRKNILNSTNVVFFDIPELNFRKLNIYNFNNSNYSNKIFDEYKLHRLNNNIEPSDAYTNYDIHTDYLFFLDQSINNKKISINCPITNNIISSDIYFINIIHINNFKIPYCICNYIFDNYIILGIGLGSGKGAMETRILYIYSIIHKKIYYNWPEYDKSLFIEKNVPIIIDFYNKIKLENYIEKNNINTSKIMSIYGFMANLGHYLFNDISGLYLLEYYDMISKIDRIYFGNNDNYFIKEYIKNKYPNIEIIEKNDDYISFMDGYIGKGVCFKYNHFFI